jgi:hypothetical protein
MALVIFIATGTGHTKTESTPMLHKQHGKEKVMVLRYTQYHSESTIFWVAPLVDSKDGIYFAHVVYPSGKPEDFRFCVVKGSR